MSVRACFALICLGGSLLVPALARAQGSPPLMDCKNFNLKNAPAIVERVREGVFKTILPKVEQLDCDDLQLFADRAEWTSDDDWLVLTGNVVVKQPGLNLYATSARINRRTKLGVFYEARGMAMLNAERTDKTPFGGAEPDVRFVADSIEKIGAKTYRLVNGSFTSCAQPTARWLMAASTGVFTLDEHVMLRNMVLKVKDVPVFYLPFIYVPIDKQDRSTGILMPSFGTSTAGGFTLSNAFFWAIDRSQDLTLYHEYLKKSGQGVGTEYRYVSSPGSTGRATFHVIDERSQFGDDGLTVVQAGRRSYDLRGDVSQGLPRGFRLIGAVNYFTNAATQQLYQQNVFDFSQRMRRVAAEVSGGVRRYRIRAGYELNDLFTGQVSASRNGYGPRANFDISDAPIGRSKVYVGARTEAAYVLRQDDLSLPETNHSMWRLDASPTIRAPLSNLSFLSANANATWHVTEWFESIDTTTNTQVPVPVTRQLLTVQARVSGPKLSRVWQPDNGYAEKIKHLIEPSVTYQWTAPFAHFDSLVPLDGAERQVSTTSLTYELTTYVHAKQKTAAGGPGMSREILRGSLSQTYYTVPLAASFDPQYQSIAGFVPADHFSSIQATVVASPAPSVSAQFRTDIDARFRTPRTLSASGTVNAKVAQVTAGWSKQQVIPGLAGFEDPKFAPHFLNTSASFKRANGHFGLTYAFNYDVQHASWLQQRIVAFYNSQCCGITMDYQTTNLAHLGRSDLTSNHKFGISFSLAGLGSFTNPFGSFGR